LPPEEIDQDVAQDIPAQVTTKDDVGSQQPAAADPSTAPDVSNQVPDDDPYQIVKDVVAKRKPKEPAASSASVEGTTAPRGERQPAKEPDNEGYSDVPFNKHPRFQELLHQRNAFKTDADRYNNVQNFLDTQGLSAEEAADMLVIGGLMKVNPVEAWKRMQPALRKLAVAAGEVLPEDLKALVQQQKMSTEAALEVSRARAATQAVEVQRSFDQQQADRRMQGHTTQLRVNAANSWEADRRRRDPNFDAKLPALQKEVNWLQRSEGIPDSPQGVQDQLRRAYEAVNKTHRPAAQQQRRPAISPVNGGQSHGDGRPKPQSTMEIIQAEIAKRGAQ
jgi:hypothetical protein